MKRNVASRLVRLFPRRWRERYGDEFEELLEREGARVGTILDVARAAGWQHALSFWSDGSRTMQTYPASVMSLARKPSAFLPIAMSLCALATVLTAVAFLNARPEPDEGSVAHIFQILIGGQFPIFVWFVLRWARPGLLKATLAVVALQFSALAMAFAPVWYFGL